MDKLDEDVKSLPKIHRNYFLVILVKCKYQGMFEGKL